MPVIALSPTAEPICGAFKDQATEMLEEHRVIVLRWLDEYNGSALVRRAFRSTLIRGDVIWEKLIECPQPTDPCRLAVMAHEVGHHELGHTLYPARLPIWKEELEAWDFAFTKLDQLGITIDDQLVELRIDCLRGQFQRSLNAGLKQIPREIYELLDPEELWYLRNFPVHEHPARIRRLFNMHWDRESLTLFANACQAFG